jgi:hypothetical protein
MIEKAIYSILTGDSDVSALVGTRVYPVNIPQNPTYPLVSFSRVSGNRVASMSGASSISMPRFEIGCFADTYSAVKTLAGKVRSVLFGYSGTIAGVIVYSVLLESDTDNYQEGIDKYMISNDYFFHHKES